MLNMRNKKSIKEAERRNNHVPGTRLDIVNKRVLSFPPTEAISANCTTSADISLCKCTNQCPNYFSVSARCEVAQRGLRAYSLRISWLFYRGRWGKIGKEHSNVLARYVSKDQ